MRGTRGFLEPVDDVAVLGDIAKRLLDQEWRSAADGVRQQIQDEIDGQSADLLAGAAAEYSALEERRRQAVRAYGRPDPVACAVAGAVAAYLFLSVAGAEFLSAVAIPGVGLAPWFVVILALALATRWRPWRRRRALVRSVPEALGRWTGVLEGVVRSFIVAWLNDDVRNFEVRIGGKSAPRLVEAIEPRPVDSEAMARIRAVAKNVHSGSLGVSGPRGVGKSTILRSFGTDPDSPQEPAGEDRDLRLVVAAPVDYEPRDFIIHLFSRLCEAVPHGPDARSAIAAETRRHQEQLRYLRTYTSGWTATLAPWAFLNLARQSVRERAEQPVSLPELVESFRGYSKDVASWRRAEHGDKARVVIAIDEVDKIRDSDRAEAFLNDVKAVFGVPGCLYLVSLSEDAMAGFARYTPSIRSSFDSAFDELVFAGPMTYRYSEQLLFQRVIGVPRPFIALCHVLAGGLPRDLVRTARALIDVTQGSGGKSLPDTAHDLIRHELESLRQSYLRQLAQNASPGPVLAALYDPRWPGEAPFAEAASQLAAAVLDAETDEARRLCRELFVSLSFYATALDAFAPDALDRLVTCLRHEGPGHALVNDLAAVRHAMRVSTMLAQQLLAQYGQHYRIGWQP